MQTRILNELIIIIIIISNLKHAHKQNMSKQYINYYVKKNTNYN